MMKCEEHKNFKGDFGCPVCWLRERESLQAEIVGLKAKLNEEPIEMQDNSLPPLECGQSAI